MPLRLSTAIFFLTLAAAAAKPPSPEALQGVITQVQGAVEAAGPGVSDLPLASPWQVIRAGVIVRVPKGGTAGIVCSNRRFVRLRGPASWSLTEPGCAGGKELTLGEYARVAPQGGRFKVVEGLLVLEREPRFVDGDDPLAPLVLSPRHTILRSPRPRFSWRRVPTAAEYELRLEGPRIKYRDRLKAGEVACSEVLEGISVCSLPWPEERPDLPPGSTFSLGIAARSGIADSWHIDDPVEITTQEVAQAAALERQLQELASLGLEGAALDAAQAGLLAENGFYADAADLYRRALAAAPAPELRVTLADLDFVTGLHSLAETRYRAALAEDAPAIRAAAAFGLGRVAYARRKYPEAAASFRQARELYSQLRLGEETDAARQAAERASAARN